MQGTIWSLLPPLLTILLALVTKNVFISLLFGIVAGSFMINAFAPLVSINAAIDSIINSMDHGNTIIIGSCLMVGAMIHLMEKSGGIQGFVDVIVKRKGIIKSKRGANLFTWLLGLGVFTSGSLSCMVTGAVSRPINDALKVPHEKAAFLVHATSTPWCVLFPFSGWLASMIGYLTAGGVAENEATSVLFKSIFLNFYCILAVLICLVLILTQKDFGPMAKAEKRAAETGLLDDPAHGAKEVLDTSALETGIKPRACNLLVPIGVLIVTMFATLLVTGEGDIMKGAGMQALIWAVVASLLSIIILTLCQKVFTLDQVISEMFKGMGHMLPAGLHHGHCGQGSGHRRVPGVRFQDPERPGFPACFDLCHLHAHFLCYRYIHGHHGHHVQHRPARCHRHRLQRASGGWRYVWRRYLW